MTRTSYFGPATWPGQSSKAFRNDGRAPLAWRAFVNALFQTDWVVYVKPAFGGAPAVLRYLGRYTIVWQSAITGSSRSTAST